MTVSRLLFGWASGFNDRVLCVGSIEGKEEEGCERADLHVCVM